MSSSSLRRELPTLELENESATKGLGGNQNFQVLSFADGGSGEPSFVRLVSSRSSEGAMRCWRIFVA
jgi:hypothetical protein